MYRQKSIKRKSLVIPNVFKAVIKQKPVVRMMVPRAPISNWPFGDHWRLLSTLSHCGLRGTEFLLVMGLTWSLPVTWVALAKVRIRARFSSSDSADSTVLGSLRKRVNCGWTSELPSAVMSLSAVLSTLEAG